MGATWFSQPYGRVLYQRALLYFPKKKKKERKKINKNKGISKGGFNQKEIEKVRIFLGSLKKPSSTYSLALSSKFPIPIGLRSQMKHFPTHGF